MTDSERIMLLYYIAKHGMPQGRAQWQIVAAICGWDEQHAKQALDQAVADGILQRATPEEEAAWMNHTPER
ncbi:MAG: hypothetical protein HC893_06360 [Chloroflexaceae bacterium]|nr:hypothetical protein [Chloroflexaceae bacterium]